MGETQETRLTHGVFYIVTELPKIHRTCMLAAECSSPACRENGAERCPREECPGGSTFHCGMGQFVRDCSSRFDHDTPCPPPERQLPGEGEYAARHGGDGDVGSGPSRILVLQRYQHGTKPARLATAAGRQAYEMAEGVGDLLDPDRGKLCLSPFPGARC
jgi:hypothetical protein